ncbi:hypothetical protein Gotur_012630 [Gossypium turneri]
MLLVWKSGRNHEPCFSRMPWFNINMERVIISGDPSERNKRVHGKSTRSGKEIAKFIKSYFSELVGIEEKTPKVIIGNRKWQHPPDQL